MKPALLPFALSLLAACAPDADRPDLADGGDAAVAAAKGKDMEFPGDAWETARNPRAHGLTPAGLADLHAAAEAVGSTCVVVIHDGMLVSEWYAPGYDGDTPHANLFSTTKSVTSTLVGIAQADGLLDIDDSAADYIPEWAGTDAEAVTVRDLLANVSGRHWSMESDYGALLFGADQTAYAVGLGQDVAPSTHWEYNNAAIQTLERVIEAATGRDVDEYAQDVLFGPIGMGASLARDGVGNALVYQGLSTSCRDLARFGHLALNGGRWRGRQVVPSAWMDEATTVGTALNDAYGLLWWLNTEGHVVEPSFPTRSEYDGRIAPAADEDVFFALGAFGQVVAVYPSEGYVVVRAQEVLDIEAAIAADPDPVGIAKLRAITGAFEAAKR